MDEARYIDKIRPYLRNDVSRFAMFVTDTLTGCTEHKDVAGDTDPDEVKAELIARLQERAAATS